MMLEVASAEHGAVNEAGIAVDSHPWLLQQLCVSLELDICQIKVAPETEAYLTTLDSLCRSSPIEGIGALGPGNEFLLLQEYRALADSFEAALPESQYSTFFNANLTQDERHHEVLAMVATGLIELGAPSELYVESAIRAAEARIEFYDSFLVKLKADKTKSQ